MDLLAVKLKKYFEETGIEYDFYVAGYNQYVQEIINPDSNFNKNKFDIAVVFIDGEEIVRNFVELKFNKNIINELVDKEIGILKQILNKNKNIVIILNSIFIRTPIIAMADSNLELGLRIFQEKFNTKIRNIETDRLLIFDFDALVTRFGYETIYDDRLWYLGRIKFSNKGLELIAYQYFLHIQAYLGKNKKVLILDLDNTLWGGIVGEDGIQGIKLGEDGIGRAYRDFQKCIKSLRNKGILLAICSKNNLHDVEEVFHNNRFMELKESDFVVSKINWEDKVKNINEISESLNLNINSFVFVDDNPFERELVKKGLPEVTVPEFPNDPANLVQWFHDLSNKYFNKTSITDEDILRSAMYQANIKRSEIKKSADTLEDFYKSLNMTASIDIDNRKNLKRIAQLIQRTNQFNLTSKRYTESDIRNFIDSDDWRVFTLELNDRFGPNGIVGVSIVKLDNQLAYIDTFLLSCRVIGRTVENALIWYIAMSLKEMGVVKLIGEFIPTQKNAIVEEMYKNFNFKLIKNRSKHSKIWESDIINVIKIKNQWIKLEHPIHKGM